MAISLDQLVDIAVDENIPPSNYFMLWEELGDWQLSTLKRIGLRSESYLLDVGCGPLRLASKAIPYLESGHYYGVDAVLPLLNVGKAVVKALGIKKDYTVVHDAKFGFDKFETKFDFGIAASVFTYSGRDNIEKCVMALKSSMKPGGRFLFTYVLQKNQLPVATLMDGIAPMRFPALQDSKFFRDLADDNGIKFEILEGVDHPTGQTVAVFTFF